MARGDAGAVIPAHYWRWAAAASIPVAWYIFSRRRRSAQDQRTDFDGFLKAVEPIGSTGSRAATRGSGTIDAFYKNAADVDTRNPVDFDSFIRGPKKASSGPQVGVATSAAAAAPAKPRPTPDHKPVLVMYGTEYGFSKEIAEKLCSSLAKQSGLWPQLENMADHPEGYSFASSQVVLMACSTQGDGVPPTEAREFCEWLFAGKAGNLGHLHFGVCALGDKSYTHFCRCGKQLDAALESSGAVRLAERVDVSKEDWPVVDAWVEATVRAVAQLSLKTFAELGVATDGEADVKGPAPKKWGKSRPYFATVVAQEGLCTLTGPGDKNTVRTELCLGDSGITYLPGDALGMYPTNKAEAVEELVAAMGAQASELVPVPSWHYEEEGGPRSEMTLAEALAKCYDIRSPKPELLKLLVAGLDAKANGHHHTNGDAHHAPSGPELLRAALADTASLEAYLAPRHVVDVLQDAAPARLSTSQVLSCLRQLQPRLYSISSSPLEDPTRVQVTVAEVMYSSLGKDRVGVCSTMLSQRIQVGTRIPVYVHKNPDFRLPASPSTPIIMVGPGTGLAPFRSFILERLLQQEQQGAKPGPMVLYFGCRRRDQDYLYGNVLEGWAADGKVTLCTAFSREQAKKVYVQDRLAQSADQVWELLQQGGHFYVCGDASSMAGAVEEALLQLVEARQGQGRECAVAYLQELSEAGRYQRDVWY